MWEFIVLGQLPGTSLQINFWTWMAIVPPVLVGILLAWRMNKQKTLNFWIIALSVYWSYYRKNTTSRELHA